MEPTTKKKPGPPKGSQAAIEAGRRGGLSTAQRYGSEHMREIGKKGGETLLEKKGRAHYVKIAKKAKTAKRQERKAG